MPLIEIDFEVYKTLTSKRETESMSYNDVIRGLLELAEVKSKVPLPYSLSDTINKDWVYKGVCFPAGTELRASYKGQLHYAIVENGHFVVNGESVTSPSVAAKIITNTNVNGWMFWECRFPGESIWKLIKNLRPARF